jgi:hypothetical protein
MQRFLVILLILFLIYLLFKSWIYSLRKKLEKHFNQAMDGSQRMVDKGKMVKCAHCSTYFPASDAIEKNIRGMRLQFCSQECLKNYKNE